MSVQQAALLALLKARNSWPILPYTLTRQQMHNASHTNHGMTEV
jgi:hypothetical protein